MSTRCNVIVKAGNQEIMFYHHCDGYPDGVGIDLAERMERVMENKWHDADDFLDDLVKDADYNFSTVCGLHGDIDYLYKVDYNAKTIICHPVRGFDENQKIGEAIDVIKLYNEKKNNNPSK